MSNTEIKRPVLSLNVVGPSDDNNEFIVGTMVDGSDQYPAIQFGGTILEAQNGELHISGDLVVDGDVYTDGSDEPVGPGGGTHVAANSGGVTTDTLRTLQVGDVNYSVPEKVIIVPNEDGVIPTETLETLQIGETVYGIPSGGGSNILDSDNVFTGTNTFEQEIDASSIGKTVTIEDDVVRSVMDFSAHYDPEDSSSGANFELTVSAPDAPASYSMYMSTDSAGYIESDNYFVDPEDSNNFMNTRNRVQLNGENLDICLQQECHASFGGANFESHGRIDLFTSPIESEENPGELVGLKSVINLQANKVLVNGEPIGSGGGREVIPFGDYIWYQTDTNENAGIMFNRGEGYDDYYDYHSALNGIIADIRTAWESGKEIWLVGEGPVDWHHPDYEGEKRPVAYQVIGVYNLETREGWLPSVDLCVTGLSIDDKSDPNYASYGVRSKLIHLDTNEPL